MQLIKAKLDGAASGPTSQHVPGAAPAKHDPFITFDGSKAVVGVRGTDGSMTTLHPQSGSHHISLIWVRDQDGRFVHVENTTGRTEAKSSSFTIPASATTLQPFEYCNLHGSRSY